MKISPFYLRRLSMHDKFTVTLHMKVTTEWKARLFLSSLLCRIGAGIIYWGLRATGGSAEIKTVRTIEEG